MMEEQQIARADAHPRLFVRDHIAHAEGMVAIERVIAQRIEESLQRHALRLPKRQERNRIALCAMEHSAAVHADDAHGLIENLRGYAGTQKVSVV